MDYRRQAKADLDAGCIRTESGQKKTEAGTLIQEFEFLFNQCSPAFSQARIFDKAREIAFGILGTFGRHTITGALTASGRQFEDWTSAYRLFSHQRIDIPKIFDVVRWATIEQVDTNPYLIAHMDDTILKKTGKKIPGTAWRRDPLGPPFQVNFMWGQRFIQISMALPDKVHNAQSRAVPVDFYHCPTVEKPKKDADKAQWESYKEQQRIYKLSVQGVERIKLLRENLDKQEMKDKQLLIGVDGSYTNSEVIKNLPPGVILIGRTRKDTKLYDLPEQHQSRGRKRSYGERLPTPEEIRKSDDYQWQEVTAWAAGKTHKFNVKVIKNVKWRPAGADKVLQLVVIRALGYRLTKKSRILYRKPAYLICTDHDLDIETLLQAYLWRWEIEVNFKEEKSLLGCGQAQVRNPYSIENVPAFFVAVYAMLILANRRAKGNSSLLPRPRWYQKQPDKRITTGDMINNFRAQIWAHAIGLNFSSFVNCEFESRSRRNRPKPHVSAMFYMRN